MRSARHDALLARSAGASVASNMRLLIQVSKPNHSVNNREFRGPCPHEIISRPLSNQTSKLRYYAKTQTTQGRSVSPRGTCGLVAMTSALHAEGRQFDPGQVYCRAIATCDGSCRMESHRQNSCRSRCARHGRLNILSHGLPSSYAVSMFFLQFGCSGRLRLHLLT